MVQQGLLQHSTPDIFWQCCQPYGVYAHALDRLSSSRWKNERPMRAFLARTAKLSWHSRHQSFLARPHPTSYHGMILPSGDSLVRRDCTYGVYSVVSRCTLCNSFASHAMSLESWYLGQLRVSSVAQRLYCRLALHQLQEENFCMQSESVLLLSEVILLCCLVRV